MSKPEPLVPADTDISGFDCFMLNVQQLFASELWAVSSGDEFKAAMALWCRAWTQSPPGSLPNDDRVLAAFSGAGAKWKKVRAMAMRGFVECSDGRLYHKTLCEDVMRAAQRKAERKERTAKATEARRKKPPHDDPPTSPSRDRNDDRNDVVTSDVTTSHRRDGTGGDFDKSEEREIARGRASLELVKSDVYRWEPTDDDRAEAAASGFTECETAELIATHRDYLSSKNKVPPDPAAAWRNFLRTRKPKRPVGGTSVGAKAVFVEQGTPQHDAWTKHRGTSLPSAQHERKTGWWVPAEWPPGHGEAAA